MTNTTITKQDLATLINIWNAFEKLYTLLERLSGLSPDTTLGLSTLGNIQAIDILIRSVAPLYRHLGTTERTDERERAITDILADSSASSEEKAEQLLAGEREDKTIFTLDDEIMILTCYEGIRELDTFCGIIYGAEYPEEGSILQELYQIEEIILTSSPVNKQTSDGFTSDDSPALELLNADLKTEIKARKLLGME